MAISSFGKIRPVIALHGGAGTLRKEDLSTAEEAQHREALRAALDAGWQLLEAGAKAVDAAEAAIRILEDCPLFNAGRGSVFNARGEIEMDAAMMDGRTLAAGAVAGVTGVRNPITLARRVMDDERFVFLVGRGAEEYALECALPIEPREYFYVQRRWEQLQAAQRSNSVALDHDGTRDKFGTVGVVARDMCGDLAAGTSTGGLTNKWCGRVGDTPIIGAGTYADNRGCAVSCTGFGEAFIRCSVGHELSARLRLTACSLEDAASAVMEDLAHVGGKGGFVAIDFKGNCVLPFNTSGMYRAWRSDAGEGIAIYP